MVRQRLLIAANAGLVLILYLKNLYSTHFLFELSFVVLLIWILVPRELYERLPRHDLSEWPWMRSLVFVFKYPLFFENNAPKCSVKCLQKTLKCPVNGLAHDALMPVLQFWKSHYKRKKFISRLRLMSVKEDNFFLLETVFLRFKANTLIMQRNFLLSTLRFANEFVHEPVKSDRSSQALLKQTIQEASYQQFSEFSSENRKNAENLNLFPTPSIQNTASYPSATGEETGNTFSIQIFDIQNQSAKWVHVKELEEHVAKLEYELQCKESQLDILKRETANLKKSLIKRSSSISSARNDLKGKRTKGDDVSTNMGTGCDSRDSEIEIKGLRAKILVLEQTLQDTNSGVEHAANVLRMQCTAHIHKSAALHSALVLAAKENHHQMEKTISELKARESQLVEEGKKQREEIEKLRSLASEHAKPNQCATSDTGTDPISPQASGESAAELAAACSGRLRDAWTQNEKLMEALEVEKRRALMLELELQQQASNAPSTWL